MNQSIFVYRRCCAGRRLFFSAPLSSLLFIWNNAYHFLCRWHMHSKTTCNEDPSFIHGTEYNPVRVLAIVRTHTNKRIHPQAHRHTVNLAHTTLYSRCAVDTRNFIKNFSHPKVSPLSLSRLWYYGCNARIRRYKWHKNPLLLYVCINMRIPESKCARPFTEVSCAPHTPKSVCVRLRGEHESPFLRKNMAHISAYTKMIQWMLMSLWHLYRLICLKWWLICSATYKLNIFRRVKHWIELYTLWYGCDQSTPPKVDALAAVAVAVTPLCATQHVQSPDAWMICAICKTHDAPILWTVDTQQAQWKRTKCAATAA